jgi:hypothetical protein
VRCRVEHQMTAGLHVPDQEPALRLRGPSGMKLPTAMSWQSGSSPDALGRFSGNNSRSTHRGCTSRRGASRPGPTTATPLPVAPQWSAHGSRPSAGAPRVRLLGASASARSASTRTSSPVDAGPSVPRRPTRHRRGGRSGWMCFGPWRDLLHHHAPSAGDPRRRADGPGREDKIP